MATDTNDTGLGLDDGRVKVGAGLLLLLVGFLGLAGTIPTPLADWVNWTVFISVFFLGVLVTLFAVRVN